MEDLGAARELLELYNAKAGELLDSSFLRELQDPATGRFRLLGGPFRAVRERSPDPEGVRAFVLTFRIFYRDRDGMSFREIDGLYQRLPLTDDLRSEVSQIRAEVQRFLDGMSPFVIEGAAISRRELLDTWLFGRVAHLNADKRAKLKQWRVADDVAPLFEHEFESILARVLQAIAWVRARNVDALRQLADTEDSRRAV